MVTCRIGLPKRVIKVEIDFPDSKSNVDDGYADVASAIGTLLKVVSEPDRFDFSVDHDRIRPGLSKDLNAHWDTYGKQARWR